MDATNNLSLPFILAAQAQKHVTHNEALNALDAVVQLMVLDKDLSAPPGSPTAGARYIVAASPAGAWSGHTGHVAAYQDGSWAFYVPREGWLAWAADEDALYVWTGSAWAAFAGGGSLDNVVEDITPQLGGALDANGNDIGFDDGTGITDDAGNEQVTFHKTASAVNQVGITNAAAGNAPQISAEGGDADIDLTLAGKGTGHPKAALFGVNATADATTKFAVAAAASLFDNAGNGHQHKVNKNAAGDMASLLFQTGSSGRAEMGTVGDDDFHLKVSADGSTWKEAIVIDRSTGAASFPLTPKREILTANRTFYVRTDGSDSNDGLANTSGGAFLTIQKAIDVACGLDLAIYSVTIQLADGTYTSAVQCKKYVGTGPITIQGNATTPANVLLDVNASIVLENSYTGCRYVAKEFKVQSSFSGAIGISVAGPGTQVDVQNMNYGAISGSGIHIFVGQGAFLRTSGSYTISGSTGWHMFIDADGGVYGSGSQTITLSGTPAFSQAYVRCSIGSFYRVGSLTQSGSATGVRYSVITNSVIDAAGGGASYLPGNASGSTASGGQYV